MKLSEAILMGDSLKKPNPHMFTGCAIGGAIMAMGKMEELKRDFRTIEALWPWLTEEHLMNISGLYTLVYLGKRTIEDVCSYVRSIEPAEPEPLPEEEFTNEPAELAVYRGSL